MATLTPVTNAANANPNPNKSFEVIGSNMKPK